MAAIVITKENFDSEVVKEMCIRDSPYAGLNPTGSKGRNTPLSQMAPLVNRLLCGFYLQKQASLSVYQNSSQNATPRETASRQDKAEAAHAAATGARRGNRLDIEAVSYTHLLIA